MARLNSTFSFLSYTKLAIYVRSVAGPCRNRRRTGTGQSCFAGVWFDGLGRAAVVASPQGRRHLHR